MKSNDLVGNKIIFTFLTILFFGAVSVFAGQITSSNLVIQADSYKSSDGSEGITENITFQDENGESQLLFIENGIIVGFTNNNSGGWWNSSWENRAEIVVTENSGDSLMEYQVPINVTYDSGMQVDFSDLRFVSSSNALLSYWIEDKVNSSWAYVYVKMNLAASSNTSLFMYYNNPLAVSLSNASDTMLYYNDFSVSNGTSESYGTRPASSVSDGVLHLTLTSGCSGGSGVYWDTGYSDDVFFKARVKNLADDDHQRIDLFDEEPSSSSHYASIHLGSSNSYADYEYYRVYNEGSADYDNQVEDYTTPTVYQTVGIWSDASENKTEFAGSKVINSGAKVSVSATPNYSSNIKVGVIVTESSCTSAAMDVDWVTYGKWINNGPTYSFGSEEIQ